MTDTDTLPPLPDHWLPITLLGASESFQSAARDYAEAYARKQAGRRSQDMTFPAELAELQPVAEIIGGVLCWHIPHAGYAVPKRFLTGDHMLYESALLEQVATLQAQLLAAQADAARIDWLDTRTESHGFCSTGRGEYRYYAFQKDGYASVRAVIDAQLSTKGAAT